MIGAAVAATVIGIDLAIKRLLRRSLGGAVLRVGPFANLRLVEGRMWLTRTGRRSSTAVLWTAWSAAACALAAAAAMLPPLQPAAGLMLGGSAANLIEHTRRGAISDYVCLPFWPAFNLADAALLAGAAGALLVVGRATGLLPTV